MLSHRKVRKKSRHEVREERLLQQTKHERKHLVNLFNVLCLCLHADERREKKKKTISARFTHKVSLL